MRLLRRLATLFRRTHVEQDIDRELAFHLEMEAAQHESRGAAPDEARRRARADFGAAAATRDEVRDARGLTFVDALIQDVRFGVRLLVRQPGFSLIAVSVLAIAIGANTAMFSIANTLLLKPRAGHVDGALVSLYSLDTAHPGTYRAFSYPNYVDMRAHADAFVALAAHDYTLAGLTENGVTRRVFIDVVTANYFETFGVTLPLGRPFTAEEERPGADIAVTVLSHAMWQRMGGRVDVIGSRIRLNMREFQVIGVAPLDFGGSMVFASPELFVPTGVYKTVSTDLVREGRSTDLGDRRNDQLVLIGQLHPHATLSSIVPALDTISLQLAAAFPDANANQKLIAGRLARLSVSTEPTDDRAVVGLSATLLSLSAIVLLVASLNLANMLLARGAARRKEFAIRLAIGGSRGRIVRQLLTEGLVLSLVGGAGGLLLANVAMRLLAATLTPISPLTLGFDLAPDWRIVAATLGYCVLATILFGLLPARRLAQTDAVPELKDHAGELGTRLRRRLTTRNALVMAQLALSLTLMTVAGLFVRGAVEAAQADPGFTLDRGIMLQIDASLAGYDEERTRTEYADVLGRLRARPDVADAAISSIVPFGDMRTGVNVQEPGPRIRRGDPNDSRLIQATQTSITAGYFGALSRPLLAGRDFTATEESASSGPRVGIVDITLARQLFGDANPIGRDIQYASRDEHAPPIVVRVVGLAPAMRDSLLDVSPEPHVYFPLGQQFQNSVYVHVRTMAPTASAEAGLLPQIRTVVQDVDSAMPILSLETRPMFRDRNVMLAMVQIGAAIFTVFGAVALFLAAIGVYGVKAYLVSRRTREIGIRVALGASPGGVVWVIARDGLAASAIGLAAGIGLSAIAGAALRSLTYQNRVADAALIGFAAAVLAGAAMLASWLPARRATRVAPLTALRG